MINKLIEELKETTLDHMISNREHFNYNYRDKVFVLRHSKTITIDIWSEDRRAEILLVESDFYKGLRYGFSKDIYSDNDEFIETEECITGFIPEKLTDINSIIGYILNKYIEESKWQIEYNSFTVDKIRGKLKKENSNEKN